MDASKRFSLASFQLYEVKAKTPALRIAKVM